jgi:outer membrane protein OmpA-like peptidoglycan-associated protein
MKYLSLLLIFLSIPAFHGFSQVVHTESNRAMKMYTEGMREYDFLNFTAAETRFREAVNIDKRFFEAHLMLGELFSRQHRYSEAKESYRAAIKIDSLFYKPAFFRLAMAEMKSGDYFNAMMHFKVYLEQEGMSDKNREIAAASILNCQFALETIKNPVPFNPVDAGNGINTSDDEYWPSITADGEKLIFTRQQVSSGQPSQEDFYISIFSDNNWQKAENAGYPLNTRQNEGAQSLSSDGTYMYFTACDRQGGMGSCDIYFSSLSDGKWSEPRNIRTPVNSSAWESQPSISADGKMLFFSSNRPGGKGAKDIWMSRMDDKNNWSVPENLGDSINTKGDEMSPFIHFDGKTLYFSSDGKIGMGGFDIFMTTMKDDSTWSQPRNLGYPINTHNDETGLVISADGTKAYFSSIRNIKNGKDIFYFELHESVRPDPVSYLKGKVFDRETGKMLKADYELTNLSTGKKVIRKSTDNSGNFLVCLPSGFNYGINVSSPGYLFYSEHFVLESLHSMAEPFNKQINLNPLKIGEKMRLANVFYEIDSWELRKESILELNNLYNLLKTNSGVIIEIGGYTDSTGSDKYNLDLSEKRALSVVNYLVNKGIEPSRLKHKGYGNTAPIGSNVTSEGRRLNRRTEAKVIGNK